MSTGVLRPLAALAGISRFGFESVAANVLDTVTVPKGYGWHVVARWGDPMWSRGTEFDQKTRGTGASQELAFGDNNDGMALFNHLGRNVPGGQQRVREPRHHLRRRGQQAPERG